MSESQLTTEILKRSVHASWPEAKREWFLLEIYESEEPETCLCGHSPIIELCILRNHHNNNEVTVGNCCVKKFIGLPSDKIFQAIKRVRMDLSKSLNVETVQHAFDRGWINDWERNFYVDIMRKRNLSENQASKKREINQLVLKGIKKQQNTFAS